MSLKRPTTRWSAGEMASPSLVTTRSYVATAELQSPVDRAPRPVTATTESRSENRTTIDASLIRAHAFFEVHHGRQGSKRLCGWDGTAPRGGPTVRLRDPVRARRRLFVDDRQHQ